MKILIINGSPAGKDSITLQTVEYLKVLFPEHEYTTIHAGQRIRAIERDFAEAGDRLKEADLIVFCYPVYTFLVPAQLHRFIELMKEYDINLEGKYATQITTSKHFYDTTAHRFIADNCADIGLRCIRGLSADMEDLLTEKGKNEAKAFFRYVMWNIGHGFAEPVRIRTRAEEAEKISSQERMPELSTGGQRTAAYYPVKAKPAKKSKPMDNLHIALVTDCGADADSPLNAMIDRFTQRFPGTCEVVNLREFPFGGGCLGCFHCASDGECIYKDNFDHFLREHINNADAVIYAYTIRDHSMGYRFKLFDDRQFCNGHRTVTMGKPVGYLVNGCISGEENLRTLMEARAEVGGNFLTGIASDEADPDREIDQLVRSLVYVIRHKYTQPKNFYGVGGLKIFRDLIYEMQGMMREDHRFYKKHGFYDFPQQKKLKIAAMYLVGALMKNKSLMKKSGMTMTDGMLMPYRKVIEKEK